MKNLKLDAVEHHWCSTISTKQDLVPRGHLFPPPLSTSCKLSNNTSLTIRQEMQNCRGYTCNQVFLVKNSKSSPTSKHIQHSSCPESGLHLCFPSSRLSRHTLQTSQWNDLSLWILFKTKNIKDSERLIDFLQLYVNETLTEPLIPYVSKSSLIFLLKRSINFQCHHIKFARSCSHYAPYSVKSYLDLVFWNVHPEYCSFK